MSREILFKGRCLHNEKWVEGGYCQKHETTYCFATDAPNPLHHYIACDEMTDWNLPNQIMLYEVDPSTVCQYTGLEDENGKKIFEGDILEGRWDDKHPEDVTRAVVEWILFGWYIHEIGKSLPDEMDESDIDIWTVVGNVFDNPELLEGGVGE